ICPHCKHEVSDLFWSGKNAFGHWLGLICPFCGEVIPCLWNITSCLVLTLLFPVWLVPYVLFKDRYKNAEFQRAKHEWKRLQEKSKIETRVKLETPKNNEDATHFKGVRIELQNEVERCRVATEEVNVPHGVTIRVKRSRSIEHTLEIDWKTGFDMTTSASLLDMLKAELHFELENRTTKKVGEIETIEYEVELTGKQNLSYCLSWTDVWRTGHLIVGDSGKTSIHPLRFREKSELSVTPIEHASEEIR
ncbi:MAG: hypothetical protein GY801_40425, partial [bacterium]|nr:hypothetical protein [bacterium]